MTKIGCLVLAAGAALIVHVYFWSEDYREACERAGGVRTEAGCIRRDCVVLP